MSNKNENMNGNMNNDIDNILSDFKEQKDRKEHMPNEPLEPPKRRENAIDFAKTENNEQSKKASKSKKESKSPEELEAIKAQKAERRAKQKEKSKASFGKMKKVIFNKKFLLALGTVIVVIALIFGIRYAIDANKGAYLKPYQSKYPDVQFEIGMLEKYCDMLGENPDTVGYIEIPELNLKSAVSNDESKFPYAQPCTENAEQFNFVIYMNDNSLEKYYSTADAYNNASGYITYSDLFKDYNFKVVGAFYTNTKAEDDNGYIFPYNTPEKMTTKSASEYVSRLENRFIYSTGANVTRQDTLLTISSPTDYRKDFRFVVVGVLREDTDSKTTATEKSDVRYPQIIFDEMEKDNTYKYASKWYPEIVITNNESEQKTIQRTIDDYK